MSKVGGCWFFINVVLYVWIVIYVLVIDMDNGIKGVNVSYILIWDIYSLRIIMFYG